jgi:hypothetical protein
MTQTRDVVFALISIVKGLIIDPKALGLLDTNVVKSLTLKIVILTVNMRFDCILCEVTEKGVVVEITWSN